MKKLPMLILAAMLTMLPALAVEENVPIALGTPAPPDPTAMPLPPFPTALPTPLPILPAEEDGQHKAPLPTMHPYMTEDSGQSATPPSTLLPTAQPTPMPRAEAVGSEYSPNSMQALYADIGEDQHPALAVGERQRLPAVLRRYAQGERPKQTILDLAENVSLGVYTLKPEDYDGEEAYALLPGRALTDDELLQVVDAFAQLGIPFGEDTLSHRNCARGGGTTVSRPLTNEESARSQQLYKLYTRQELRSQTPFTALPGDDGTGTVRLNAKDHHGMPIFAFLPYRPMTDEELLRNIEHGNASQAGITLQQYAAYERKTRAALASILGAPLSMELSFEEFTDTRNMPKFLPKAKVYSAYFHLLGQQEGLTCHALLDTETDRLLWAVVYDENITSPSHPDLYLDPFREKWQSIAEDYVHSIRKDGVRIKAILPRGEAIAPDARLGASVHVEMEDGGEYHLILLNLTETVSPFIEYLGQPPLDEESGSP